MAASKKITPSRKAALAGEIRDEPDPQWRAWFLQVEAKRTRLASGRGPLRLCRLDGEAGTEVISRRVSRPAKLKTLIRAEATHSGRRQSPSLEEVALIWRDAAGPGIAEDTAVFSFKNGVLTVIVGSSALHQEIRQFHRQTILARLRSLWSLSMPLVRVHYKQGKI